MPVRTVDADRPVFQTKQCGEFFLLFQPRVPIMLCTLTSHSRETMTDAASGAEERSDDFCESADALASFKSDVWKRFCS